MTDEQRERFNREAQAVARLVHPYVCRLYDVGHDHDLDYLVMEFLEGETLAARMARGRAADRRRGRRLPVRSPTRSRTAHQHGLVHRDLKPGNVMLTPSGAKLLDFGLAKYLSGSEPGGGVTSSTLDRRRRHRRHAAIHGAGADRRAAARRALRHLRARRDSLRDARRPAGVLRRHGVVDDGVDPDWTADAAAHAAARRLAVARRRGGEMPRQAAGRSLVVGGRGRGGAAQSE